MSGIESDFDDRLRRLEIRRPVAGGPLRPGNRRPAPPLRAAAAVPLAAFLVLFLVFKGVVIAHLGGAAYEARLVALGQGGLPMRIGVAVLQPYPVSLRVARELGPLLR
ncbi:hypothetical protein [Pukyongiella litopenaei]|uniref:Uncharacterized protein n=1 Tax=Pukyongiella litopenaei TaxID=2605946 RepID=A0A2S0MTF0_9RHOB|nr:hypothetical protein [Pukyongiella litopenaei]AVO39001.1 hypothetical protein C6Y53_15650 [Pukyongiella litopenaei]